MSDEAPRPLLRVVRGDPTPEEVAALVAVLTTYGEAPSPPPARACGWTDRTRQLRRTPTTRGPAAWLASGWQR